MVVYARRYDFSLTSFSVFLPCNLDLADLSLPKQMCIRDRSRTFGCSSTALEKVILKTNCIFCNKKGQKKIKEKGVWTTETTTVFECQGWRTMLETAENERDEKFLRRICGFDLSARETRFNSSFRRQCRRTPTQLNLSRHYF